MALFTNSRLLCAAVGTEGTWSSPIAAANVQPVMEIKRSIEAQKSERKRAIGRFGKDSSRHGAKSGAVTFKMDLVGAESAGTAPACGMFLKACGFKETIHTGTAAIAATVPNVANLSGSHVAAGPTVTGTYTGGKSGRLELTLMTVSPGDPSLLIAAIFYPSDGTTPDAIGTLTVDTDPWDISWEGLSIDLPASSLTAYIAEWSAGDRWSVNLTSADEVSVSYRKYSPLEMAGNIFTCLNMAVIDTPGKTLNLHSCRGNVKINLPEVGAIGSLEFDFKGVINEANIFTDTGADTDFAADLGLPDVVPPPFMGAEVSLFGDTDPICVGGFDIDCGNTVTPKKCHTATHGFSSVEITDHAVSGNLKADAASDLADFNPFSKLVEDAVGEFYALWGSDSSVGGGAGGDGNTIKISARKMQVGAPPTDDDNSGILGDGIPVDFVRPESDGSGTYYELEILFT